MDVELPSARLVLRLLHEADIPAIVAGLNDFEVAQYLPVPHPYREADARAWLASVTPPHFAIDLPGQGLVGAIGIGPGLGYWLARPFQGRGLMTEACLVILDWYFAAFPDKLLPSGAYADNTASLNVQRKLGFIELPGVDMRFARSRGRDVPHINTTLSHVDYEAAKTRLRSRSWT